MERKPPFYWTKEKCIEDAKQYISRSEWKKKSHSAYAIALRNKWLDDCCGHMERIYKPNNYWSKERCIEDAKQYSTRIEWRKKSKTAYNVTHKNKWLDECCQHMIPIYKPKGYWTKERCIEDAKQYSTRIEWRKKEKSGYNTAVKNNWLDDCCKHMGDPGSSFKRLIYVYIFSDKSVYVGLTYDEKRRKRDHLLSEINRKKSSVFKYVYETKLKPKYKKLTDFLPKNDAAILEQKYIEKYRKKGYKILNKIKGGGLGGGLKWTKKLCVEDAKQYISRGEWSKKSPGAYRSSRMNKWLDECCSHMELTRKLPNYWTKERCIEDAKQYSKRKEWQKKSRGAYVAATKNKWLDDCCAHMKCIRKPVGYWTKERCIKDAKQYKKRRKWKINSKGAYQVACRNKWLDECCGHMIKRKSLTHECSL